MRQLDVQPEVLVVGAGPSGLMVAAELQSGGVRTTLLERRTEQESNLTRAFAVHARTLEVLDLCGVADELVARGQRVDQFQLFSHINVDLSGLPTRFPYVLVTPQYETERVLRERALRVGAEILTGQELVCLQQDVDRINVEVRAADGTVTRRSAAYLIGADGAHSTVRQQLSMPFSGHSSRIGWLILADVRLTERPPEVFTAKASGEDFAFIAPFGDGWYRVFVWNRQMRAPEDEDVSLDTVRKITRRVVGTDFGMHDARWISRFHNDERQVPHYRQGRSFLVGDAAHVHSPAGAQGMNTGIQDAFNLGWKLSSVATGRAPATLLETYDAERRPIGASVIRLTERLVNLVVLRNAFLREVRDTVGGMAVRLPPVSRRIAGALSGIGIRYSAPAGADSVVGRRVPDVLVDCEASTPQRLYEVLRQRKPVLVAARSERAAVSEVVRPWLRGVELAFSDEPAIRVMLVRPDAYVGWVSNDAASATRTAHLTSALERWCGTPLGPDSTGNSIGAVGAGAPHDMATIASPSRSHSTEGAS